MPKRVDKVPNPWLPYQDGSVWEFTQEEWDRMPRWSPVLVHKDGRTQMYKVQLDKVYVVFAEDTAAALKALDSM